MNLSVVTCLHAPGNRFILETAKSLLMQTLMEFEWVILENHGGRVPGNRVGLIGGRTLSIHQAPPELEGIGALKRHANLLATGDVLVELDADDLLRPDALERTLEKFEAGAEVVYSDFAEFKDEGEGQWTRQWADEKGKPLYPYGGAFGWKDYPVVFEGKELLAERAPEATAHNLRSVLWAPNHLRAWRRDVYEAIGAHDETMAVCDDHELMTRFFLADSRFSYIPECLYFYRVHGDNTVGKMNAAIQTATSEVYNQRIWPLASKWTEDHKLMMVDLCGGIDAPEGFYVLDQNLDAGKDGVACDLNARWPLEDSSVGLLRAHDALEHLRDPVHVMNEAFRVLAPGGFFMISVPSTSIDITVETKDGPRTFAASGRGAFCDPTHVSFWNRLNFRYFTNKDAARYVPRFKGRFQTSRVLEWFPTDWHREESIPYVEAHLFCAKDGFRAMGEWGWD